MLNFNRRCARSHRRSPFCRLTQRTSQAHTFFDGAGSARARSVATGIVPIRSPTFFSSMGLCARVDGSLQFPRASPDQKAVDTTALAAFMFSDCGAEPQCLEDVRISPRISTPTALTPSCSALQLAMIPRGHCIASSSVTVAGAQPRLLADR